MHAWTYPAIDWLTGAPVIDDLQIQCDDGFSDGMGVATGTLNGSIGIDSLPIPVDEALLPWRRVVFPCYFGRPMGAYVVTAKAIYRPGMKAVPFVAQRMDAVLARRKIWSTFVFVQQDQLDIARTIVGYAVGQTAFPFVHADYQPYIAPKSPEARIPWFSLGAGSSDQRRDFGDNDDGFVTTRDLKVSDALSALAGRQKGFEVRLDYFADPTLRVMMRFGYPNLGRPYPVIPLEYPGSNATTWTQAEDTSDTETATRAFGAGQGALRIVGPVQVDAIAHQQGWPLLEGSLSSTASELTTLADLAAGQLRDRRRVNEGWSVTVDESAVGTYDLGDLAVMRIKDPRWGTRELIVRIIGHRIYPSHAGVPGKVVLSVLAV